MGLILGDSTVGLGWIISRPVLPWVHHLLQAVQARASAVANQGERTPLRPRSTSSHQQDDTLSPTKDTSEGWPKSSLTTPTLTLRVVIALLVLYLVSQWTVFRQLIPPFAATLVAIFIPPAAFISMRLEDGLHDESAAKSRLLGSNDRLPVWSFNSDLCLRSIHNNQGPTE